jgi:hypothetical protein
MMGWSGHGRVTGYLLFEGYILFSYCNQSIVF